MIASLCAGCVSPESEEEIPAEIEGEVIQEDEAETPAEIEIETVPEDEAESPEEISETETVPQAEPTGEGILAYVTEENNYKNWELWPGTGEFDPGKGPHGDSITIYVSESAFSAIDEKAGVMPEGSTVLKEGYNSEGELIEVVVMHKVEGFDPAHNDWFWLAYDADGEIISEGKVLGCYNCHTRKADNDYLFTGDLK